MLPYSKEMRRDVLAACDRGEGTRIVALRFQCSESWVRRAKQERRELGKTAPILTRRRVPKWEVYRVRIIELIEWVGRTVVLIYREKHSSIACRFGDIWPPGFVEIQDDWSINGNTLNYVEYKKDAVGRLSLPDLEVMDSISMSEAFRLGIVFD